MDRIRIEHYAGDDANAHAFVGIGFHLWFSYETCVAFATKGYVVVSENAWSTTTGRHIGCIPHDKRHRIPLEEFEAKLRKFLDAHGLIG